MSVCIYDTHIYIQINIATLPRCTTHPCNHLVAHAGNLIEVIAGAVGDHTKDEFFRRASTEGHGDAVEDLLLGHQCDLLGQVLGKSQSTAHAGDNGDLI
jgi:hypothetical protein